MNQGVGKTVKTFPFNGESKTDFNIYFSLTLSRVLEICSAEDLVGNYQIVFEGTNYKSIQLKVLNKYLPGAEGMFEPIC